MWMRLGMLLLIAAAGSGCTGMGGTRVEVHYAPELIDGKAAFGHTVAAAPTQELLEVSPAMQQFIAEDVGKAQFAHTRFHRLMRKMVREGFFINQYDRSATFSAAETFDTKKGNCIAYTNMFIALAREARLEASYQLVHEPPRWEVESGFLLRANHINVHIKGVRLPGEFSNELSVDFNEVEPDDDSPREIISDAHAASMFYANLSVDHLHKDEYEAAFGYLKRAIQTAPTNIDVWNNLGALYSILEKDELAEQAYQVARSINARDKTAISGLVKVLRKQGRNEEAEGYHRLVIRYRDRNPYYHYAVAEQAFRSATYEEALTAIGQAIKLKRNNARFYALRAAAAQELGDEQLFAKSVRLQRRHGKDEEDFALFTVSD